MQALAEREGNSVVGYDLGDSEATLEKALADCDVVIHLAGVNRPRDEGEFDSGNRGFTERLCDALIKAGCSTKVVMTSSVQATLDNPYGASKLAAEKALERYAADSGAEVLVLRLANVFGKWSRPNYNSVVATFCHNAWRGLPLEIHDPDAEIRLVHVDHVIAMLLSEIDAVGTPVPGCRLSQGPEAVSATVGELARTIQGFADMRNTCLIPDMGSEFIRLLYSTYLSYADPAQLAYPLDLKTDERGDLAEFIKSPHAGQVFVSRTRPGVTRGNHYHQSKVEKFLVVEGTARISLRDLVSDVVVSFDVDGTAMRVVDIPPGCTHSIENIGDRDIVVLFWSSEVFDPERPDTFFSEVSH